RTGLVRLEEDSVTRVIRWLALAAGIACFSQPAVAQSGHAAPRDAFRVIGDAEWAKLPSGAAPLVLSTLADHQSHYVLIAGRSGPGEVEIHEHWLDYMVIQQGEAE